MKVEISNEEIEELTKEMQDKTTEEIYTILRLAGEKKFDGAIYLEDNIFLAENYKKFTYKEVN
jgi:hypothetical protein